MHKDPQGLPAPQDLKVLKEILERKALLVLQDPRAHKALKDRSDKRARLDQTGPRVKKDRRALKVLKVQPDRLDLLGQPARKAHKENRATRVKRGVKEHLVPLVLLDLPDLKDPRETLAPKARRESTSR